MSIIKRPQFQWICKACRPLTLDGDLKPDIGSLTLSSVNFNKQASAEFS